ncbi:MAG: SCP2 sterol-binding domain-containing protein [Chloroflexi bacterium]|nr:SCP2 sterol-binding domain-containing protein [Chloroflexota bacterium]
MPKVNTIQQVFDLLPRYFRPEKARDVRAVVQFHIPGAGGGDWIVRVDQGRLSVEPGVSPTPADLTVTVSAENYWALLRGEMDPLAAYMRGRLRIEGDLKLAYRLQDLFRMPDESVA